MNEALRPSPSLLCKLGSIAVHVDEMMSITGHDFDRDALMQLLSDEEVSCWIQQMSNMAMVPKKRTIEDLKLYVSSRSKKK